MVEANEYWDAVTTHTPAAQRDPVSGMYLVRIPLYIPLYIPSAMYPVSGIYLVRCT